MIVGRLINLTFRRFGAAFELNFLLCQLGGVSSLHSNPWLGALGCWRRNVQMVLLPLCRRRCKLYPEIFCILGWEEHKQWSLHVWIAMDRENLHIYRANDSGVETDSKGPEFE